MPSSLQHQSPLANPSAVVPPHGLAGLSPAYFAMVMATGIVSLAVYLQGMELIARVLFWINCSAWLMLVLLYSLRMARHPARVFGDMFNHWRGPGFFTAVAGTSVLGSQFLVFEDNQRLASALAVIAGVLWIGLTYAIFTAFTIKTDKPPLDKGISGAWLLIVVATQSLAVLSALLAAYSAPPPQMQLNFFALAMWLAGAMLYVWIMALIFYRCLFLRLSPSELTPPYWINMGAMAISTLAGSLLISNATDAPFLASLLPFLKGLTVLYWATGTWWIPMLLLLGVWRYVYKRYPLRYDPLYWGAVFPLGMYSAGTHEMMRVLSLDFLEPLAASFAYTALGAWSAVFLALMWRLGVRMKPKSGIKAI